MLGMHIYLSIAIISAQASPRDRHHQQLTSGRSDARRITQTSSTSAISAFCVQPAVTQPARRPSVLVHPFVQHSFVRGNIYMLRPSLVSTKAVPSSTRLNSEFFT
eukprot:TRINITY_DN908_c0_g1_i11.p1 TRINITY_DN908_c0_g1~~TRINITY_DN908_c0_g1_i11.p1  ORF type:complete len:105 (+),score=6.90 TRINITY_DN908_c0_g1_i11:44-358(+)